MKIGSYTYTLSPSGWFARLLFSCYWRRNAIRLIHYKSHGNQIPHIKFPLAPARSLPMFVKIFHFPSLPELLGSHLSTPMPCFYLINSIRAKKIGEQIEIVAAAAAVIQLS